MHEQWSKTTGPYYKSYYPKLEYLGSGEVAAAFRIYHPETDEAIGVLRATHAYSDRSFGNTQHIEHEDRIAVGMLTIALGGGANSIVPECQPAQPGDASVLKVLAALQGVILEELRDENIGRLWQSPVVMDQGMARRARVGETAMAVIEGLVGCAFHLRNPFSERADIEASIIRAREQLDEHFDGDQIASRHTDEQGREKRLVQGISWKQGKAQSRAALPAQKATQRRIFDALEDEAILYEVKQIQGEHDAVPRKIIEVNLPESRLKLQSLHLRALLRDAKYTFDPPTSSLSQHPVVDEGFNPGAHVSILFACSHDMRRNALGFLGYKEQDISPQSLRKITDRHHDNDALKLPGGVAISMSYGSSITVMETGHNITKMLIDEAALEPQVTMVTRDGKTSYATLKEVMKAIEAGKKLEPSGVAGREGGNGIAL